MKVSLLALPLAAAAYSAPATVYLQPNPRGQARLASTPSLSPYEANSVLANFVGLGHSLWSDVVEHVVDAGKEEWDYLLNLVHPHEQKVGAGSPDVIMLLLQSDHPEDFIPSHLKPSFIIPDAPPVSSFTSLIDIYASKAHSFFDIVISSLLHSKTPSSPSPLLNVFDLASSESSALFMEELRALVGLVEAEDKHDENEFTALNFEGLSMIAAEHGRDSDVYQTAAKSIQAVLSNNGVKSRKLALIVLPTTTTSSPHRHIRAAARSAKHIVLPVYSVSQCFKSSETCTNSTNGCSGRGECVGSSRAGKTCFSCACQTTKDAKGRKEDWAGNMCERKDISVPFVLLVGSTIFLLLLVIGSVQILYSIGEGVLPSTLTSTSTGHLKRE